MNAEFIQSWKGSLAIAAVVTIAITGYKIVVGRERPLPASQMVEQQAGHSILNGKLPANLRASVVLENTNGSNLHFTLDNLETFFKAINGKVSWESVDEKNFVMRIARENPLTQVLNVIGIQFVRTDAKGLPNLDQRLSPGAVKVEALALDGEVLHYGMTQALLYQYQVQILGLREQGKL